MAVEDILLAYIQKVILNVSTQDEVDSIAPDTVGDIGIDLANILRQVLPGLGRFTITSGSVEPTGGADTDLYFQSGLNQITVWRNFGGTWVSSAAIPTGLTSLVDGKLTGLRVALSNFIATVTDGSWIIDNALFSKATQTQFTLAPAHATLLRYDSIYANKANAILIVAGEPSATPVAPDLPVDTILVETITVPSVASGKAPFSDFSAVDISGKADVVYVDQQIQQLDDQIETAQESANIAQESVDALELLFQNNDANLVHKSGAENVGGSKNFTSLMAILNAVNDNNPVALGQYYNLVNTARYWRIQKSIPGIRVLTSGINKCKEFLQIVPANNYCHVKISVVNSSAVVKDYEFMAGYDALGGGAWYRLIPINVYADRPGDFEIEIKKVDGFGPLNFGIQFRYHNTGPVNGDAVVQLTFALELPAVGPNYDQFNVLTTPEYDFLGSTPIYGRQLTLTSDGKNWIDPDGNIFLKSNSSAIVNRTTDQTIAGSKTWQGPAFYEDSLTITNGAEDISLYGGKGIFSLGVGVKNSVGAVSEVRANEEQTESYIFLLPNTQGGTLVTDINLNAIQEQIDVLANDPIITPYTYTEYLSLSGEPENEPMTYALYLAL